jgi:glycosyltransferase involved in cell wall biosynthesis
VIPLRVALLVPSVVFGSYWRPVLAELERRFAVVRFYTGQVWPDFSPSEPGAGSVRQVGRMTFRGLARGAGAGYTPGVMLLSPRVVGHLARLRPHVVFAQAFSLWTVFAVLLKPVFRWRFVLLLEGSSPNVDLVSWRFRRWVRILLARACDVAVANSDAAADFLVEVCHLPRSRVRRITYLVPDPALFPPATDRPRQAGPVSFLVAGQVVPRKGLEPLVEACAQLSGNFTLTVVGEGEQRPALERRVVELGLTDRVRWLGWVPYQQLARHLQAADVFVFPTFEDTWGMVALEAMALGTPVVCSRFAGAAELIVDGDNGILADPGDPATLAAAMARFLDDPGLADTLGKAAARTLEGLSPTATAEGFADLVAELDRGRSPDRRPHPSDGVRQPR